MRWYAPLRQDYGAAVVVVVEGDVVELVTGVEEVVVELSLESGPVVVVVEVSPEWRAVVVVDAAGRPMGYTSFWST